MIKVIKDGRIKQATCPNCNSILEYIDADTVRQYCPREVGTYGIDYTYNKWKNTIICPVCGEDVIVP